MLLPWAAAIRVPRPGTDASLNQLEGNRQAQANSVCVDVANGSTELV